jgi:hypothetical protein
VPISTALGSALPWVSTVTVGATISVRLRLAVLPWNSATEPRTDTPSPTTTPGAVVVNTKTASEVRALPSPTADWR